MRLANDGSSVLAMDSLGFDDVVRFTFSWRRRGVWSLLFHLHSAFRWIIMRNRHRRHAGKRRSKLRAIVGELSQPKSLFVFIRVHRHDRDFIARRQFR